MRQIGKTIQIYLPDGNPRSLKIAETTIKANRYSLENSNSPSKSHVSESVEADLYDHFKTRQVLVSTLGYLIFDEFFKLKNK